MWLPIVSLGGNFQKLFLFSFFFYHLEFVHWSKLNLQVTILFFALYQMEFPMSVFTFKRKNNLSPT